jgi:hypothetical protein
VTKSARLYAIASLALGLVTILPMTWWTGGECGTEQLA